MRRLTLGLLLSLLAGGSALANDTSFPNGLTGDWDGTRTGLKNSGWQFQVKGTFEGATNPAGGDRHAAAGAGEIDFAALADLGKLIGDDGGSLEARITDRFGANLVDAAGLHTLMNVQEINGRGDIWRLTTLSFAQDLFDKKANIELGRIHPGKDFDVFACNFQNLSFCSTQAGNLNGDYWFNSPVSQWGARLKINPTDDVSLLAAAYQINPVNLKRGFSFDFGGGVGTLIPFEVQWKPKLIGDLPGDYQIGGWVSDMTAPDVFFDVNRDPRAVTGLAPLLDHGRSGFFLTFRQQVTGEAPPKDAPAGTNGKGLTLFANFVESDRATSMTDRELAVGGIYKGAIPGREDDEIALAFAVTDVNGRLAQGQALHNAAGLLPFEPVQHSEYVTELDYRFLPTAGLEISPNIQFIADPGGVSARGTVVVLGLKGSASL